MAALRRRTVLIGLGLAGVGLMPGCSSSADSTRRFCEQFQSDLDADITLLASPAQALKLSPLIVHGSLRSVVSGVKIVSRNLEMNRLNLTDHRFATLVVSVDKVIAGDSRLVVDGLVYLNNRSGESDAVQLEKIRPAVDVVAVTYLLPKVPMFESAFERTSVLPTKAPLLGSYPDGTWLQGRNDTIMSSLYGGIENLSPAWDEPRTLSDYEARIVSAR